MSKNAEAQMSSIEAQMDTVNKRVLYSSAVFVLFLTALGLSVGLLTSSQAILFDGLFNLVGIGITYVSIFAAAFIRKRDWTNYPFTKDAFEPFIAIIKYAVILYLCISNIVSAVNTIVGGGNLMNLSSGVMYGVAAGGFNLLVLIYLRRQTRHNTTVIAEVEIIQWKFSCWLSCALLAGFGISSLLERTAFVVFAPYADASLTILITLFFIWLALKSIKECTRELLQAKPSDDICQFIIEKEAAASSPYLITDKVFRLSKIGGQITIEIDYVIESGCELDSVTEQDKLRELLLQSFAELQYKKWLNISFVCDKKWVKHYV